ncbi:MAG: SpoIID/LytB domain-containing protein [Firmicutes bacterium]|nr:SpoIID/LytB domain-containing protein [Bacillota bacterium]
MVGSKHFIRFLTGVSIAALFLTVSTRAFAAVPGMIRVALVRQADSLSFKTTGSYQLVDRSNNKVITVLRPGETYRVFTVNGRIALQQQGKPEILGPFGQSVLVREGAFAATVVSAGGKKTEVDSAGELIALTGAGTKVNLADRDRVVALGAAGAATLPGGGGLSLFSLDSGTGFKRYRGSLELCPGNGKLAAVDILPVEDYLRGVVPCEMPASWPLEALKAQAVAARNYALKQAEVSRGGSYDVVNDQYSQVYGGYDAEDPATNRAVDETRGMVMLCQGTFVDAFFHSSSGGRTENSEDVWREPLPYIRWKDDPYDKNDRHYNWQVTYTADQLREQLNSAGYPYQTVTEIEELARTGSGARIEKIAVAGTGKDGKTLRQTIGNADSVRIALGLKGAPFAMEKTKDRDKKLVRVTFKGSGYGHGLGMSQWGASGMAKAGYNYQDILKYYYTGISLVPGYGRGS